ncbi:MAG TPA: hypothetical protein VLI90_06385, partial [Tepidisphaeraceae bacterium]|nr:hypothetical protein [Tepidisphaeraceae bacterium]
FVDAHSYWDHPRFPHKAWDASDWLINNTPMVDQPERATLWSLIGTRVAGKPFTVTEYNHPAPNEWQAECVPIIATCAALQDWDGVFLFAYSHSADFEKEKVDGFFNIEGNPLKMPLMPMGARLFLGGAIEPRGSAVGVAMPHELMVQTSPSLSTDQGAFLRSVLGLKWQHLLSKRISVHFDDTANDISGHAGGPEVGWTSDGAGTGTGRYTCFGPKAAVFTGFAAGRMPIDLGAVRIESLQMPFATIIVTPADPTTTIEQADRLLVMAVARGQNTDMKWDAQRHTVSNEWGSAPPRVEVVRGSISVSGQWSHVRPLSSSGQPVDRDATTQLAGGRTTIRLGETPALAYEVSR